MSACLPSSPWFQNNPEFKQLSVKYKQKFFEVSDTAADFTFFRADDNDDSSPNNFE